MFFSKRFNSAFVLLEHVTIFGSVWLSVSGEGGVRLSNLDATTRPFSVLNSYSYYFNLKCKKRSKSCFCEMPLDLLEHHGGFSYCECKLKGRNVL